MQEEQSLDAASFETHRKDHLALFVWALLTSGAFIVAMLSYGDTMTLASHAWGYGITLPAWFAALTRGRWTEAVWFGVSLACTAGWFITGILDVLN